MKFIFGPLSEWLRDMSGKPSAEALIEREYEEAKRELIVCQKMRDYYHNMSSYQRMRLKRLREAKGSYADK